MFRSSAPLAYRTTYRVSVAGYGVARRRLVAAASFSFSTLWPPPAVPFPFTLLPEAGQFNGTGDSYERTVAKTQVDLAGQPFKCLPQTDPQLTSRPLPADVLQHIEGRSIRQPLRESAIEYPKKSGNGVRVLGVPTVLW